MTTPAAEKDVPRSGREAATYERLREHLDRCAWPRRPSR
jgi:hypothetical protein